LNLLALVFLQKYIYTGYYSDVSGNFAEYSLAPLKISNSKMEIPLKDIEK